VADFLRKNVAKRGVLGSRVYDPPRSTCSLFLSVQHAHCKKQGTRNKSVLFSYFKIKKMWWWGGGGFVFFKERRVHGLGFRV